MTRRRTFFVAALPATLSYDGSNDLLDPTEGFRLSGRFSPEASLQSGTFFYSRAQIDGSFYQPVSDTVTIAGRRSEERRVGKGLSVRVGLGGRRYMIKNNKLCRVLRISMC